MQSQRRKSSLQALLGKAAISAPLQGLADTHSVSNGSIKAV